MFHFEIELAKFIKEMQDEREAQAAKKAEEARLNSTENYVRNSHEAKNQGKLLGKRGGGAR